MKKTTQILALSVLCLTLLLTACNQECDCSHVKTKVTEASTRAVDLEENKTFRQRLAGSMTNQLLSIANVSRFSAADNAIPESVEPDELDLLSKDILAGQTEAAANVEATELVTSIFNALIAAESTANQLNVEFSMSDAPVENGSFIFSIDTEEDQELTLMMYDEEGFGMVANNQFIINEGNNYKALNVQSLEPGAYIFKLRNEKEGKELIRRLEIAE